MIEGFRKFSKSIFGKVLFIFVGFAFAAGFWYVGNPFASGAGTWAVQVGDMRILPETLNSEYQRDLTRLREARGGRLTAEEASAMGLPQAVLGRIVSRALIDSEINALGLTVSDSMVRDYILGNPGFRGSDGRFDREIYSRGLARFGLNERQYEEIVRVDLARTQFQDTLEQGVAVPRVMADSLYRLTHQKRVADVIAIDIGTIALAAEPDEAELRAYYDANATAFEAPEFRTVRMIALRPEALAVQDDVSDAQVDAAYQERITEFMIPERRTVRQIVTPDQDAAQRAYERLVEGEDFATVAAEETGQPAAALALGSISSGALIPELAEPTFTLEVGGVTEPIQTLFGWTILTVDAITPAEPRPLAEVREELRAILAREAAADSLYGLAASLDDLLGGGATLAEAAQQLGFGIETSGPFDAEGRDPDGTAVSDLPREVVATAFATAAGTDSLLEEFGEGGYYVLRVVSVTPAAPRPFAEVRDQVAAAFGAERRLERARADAETAMERLKAGADPAALAEELGHEAFTTPFFDRSGTGADRPLPTELVRALFAAARGEPVTVETADALYVAEVTEIEDANPAADSQGVEDIVTSLAPAIGNDLMTQVLDSLRQRYPVQVNPQALEEIF